jgi:hypothetical protein
VAANDTKTLHEASEPHLKGMVSLMDILGPSISCDQCGRWQRIGTLMESECRPLAAKGGWTFEGEKDFCPICSAGEVVG